MALVLIQEVISDADFTVDEKGILADSRKFLVQTTLDDNKQAAINYTGIARYSAHPRESRLVAKTGKAKQISLGFFWVEIGYDTKPLDKDDSNKDPKMQDDSIQPDLRPYLVSWGDVKFTKLLAPDDFTPPVAGPKPVINAAGTPFDPPPSIPASNTVCTITGYRSVAAVLPSLRSPAFRETVNSDDYVLPGNEGKILAHTGLCTDYHFELEQIDGTYWRKFKIDIQINLNKWNPLRVMNAGCYTRLSNNLPPQPILGRGGKAITKPVCLSEDGSRPLRVNEAPNYINFIGYIEKTWSGAGNLI